MALYAFFFQIHFGVDASAKIKIKGKKGKFNIITFLHVRLADFNR